MLEEDPTRSHLPANIHRIAALYDSTNSPLVQPAGRSAQSAHAAVVALQDGPLYEVVVALTLAESGENILYTAPKVAENALAPAIDEALNFAESMGFILDVSGWSNLDEIHKTELVERIPAFREPPPREQKVVERLKVTDPMTAVARLFAAFCALLLVHCGGMSAEQRTQASEIHQQLGDNLLSQGDAQQALKEYLQSVDFDDNPEARNGLGLIYWYSLGRWDDGEKQFKRALELRPDYSEALTNLGALYISRGRFAEAVPLLDKAARDPLHKARAIAQTDLGWALYKSGKVEQGIGEIRGALGVAPKYCLGWRQLGTIFSEQNRLDEANEAFSRYATECPDVPDAHLQSGKVLARLSRAAQARAEFERCAVVKNDKDKPVAAECAKFLREMGTP